MLSSGDVLESELGAITPRKDVSTDTVGAKAASPSPALSIRRVARVGPALVVPSRWSNPPIASFVLPEALPLGPVEGRSDRGPLAASLNAASSFCGPASLTVACRNGSAVGPAPNPKRDGRARRGVCLVFAAPPLLWPPRVRWRLCLALVLAGGYAVLGILVDYLAVGEGNERAPWSFYTVSSGPQGTPLPVVGAGWFSPSAQPVV